MFVRERGEGDMRTFSDLPRDVFHVIFPHMSSQSCEKVSWMNQELYTWVQEEKKIRVKTIVEENLREIQKQRALIGETREVVTFVTSEEGEIQRTLEEFPTIQDSLLKGGEKYLKASFPQEQCVLKFSVSYPQRRESVLKGCIREVFLRMGQELFAHSRSNDHH